MNRLTAVAISMPAAVFAGHPIAKVPGANLSVFK
jgi:hypothetical protein